MRLTRQIAPYQTDSYLSQYYQSDDRFSAATDLDRVTIRTPEFCALDVGGNSHKWETAQTLSLNTDASWDFGQSIGTWQAGHSYSVGDWVRPTSIADGALNTSTAYATPTMSAATSKTGQVITATSERTGGVYVRWNAFSQILGGNSRWTIGNGLTPSVDLPQSIMVDMRGAEIINKYQMYSWYSPPEDWVLQGSNNTSATVNDAKNSNGWTDLDTRTSAGWGNVVWSQYFTFSNSTAYRFYRIYITSGVTDCCIDEIKLVAQPQLVYKCTSAGTSGSSEPTWGTTVAGTTSDSGVTWTAYYDDTVAINRAGTDYYIYACQTSTIAPKVVLSRNSTYPHGYTADNSRKIGGFHCLCNSVGTIANHDLTGYLTGDVLPMSVWSLNFKSDALTNAGLVFSPKLNKWVGIYLTSGSTSVPTIVNGGTILDTITYYQATDAATALYMRLPKDHEFQVFAAGSPEGVNIYGSADPVTTGGYISTGSVRMISNIGCEGCAGQLYQWLDETSYRFDAAANHTHSVTLDGNAQASVTSGNASGDVAPAWSWKAQTGGKGSLYTQGTYGIVKAAAGSDWEGGVKCGSRSRHLSLWLWTSGAGVGTRFIAEHIDRRV